VLEWQSPLWLLLLPLTAVLPLVSRQPRLLWPSLQAVRARAGLRALLAPLPRLLAAVGLSLLVVGLARPQQVDRQRVVEREGIDIVLVVDTSGSMEAEDFKLGGRSANRLEVAKEVLARFVEGRADDRVGLVVFGQEAFTQVPLTLDHDALVGFLDQVQIGMAGERSTAVGDAIAVAARRLKDLDAESKVMILLTDGRSNSGQLEPIQAAQAAAALGIKVYTIGVGGGGGGLMGMFRGRGDLDERTLTAVAELTGAQYFRADDTEALAKVYRTIDQLEKTTAEAKEFVHRDERYRLPVALGLLALLLHLLLGETWLRRLP
jgi:Ca-activated chloride channel homolog